MENNQTDFDRLLAGQVASDDPALGRVATFLDQVQAAQTLPDVEPVAPAHLLRMRQAIQSATTESSPHSQGRMARRSRRLIIGTVAGILAGISAGVGVAAAAGTPGQPWTGWFPWGPAAPTSQPAPVPGLTTGPQTQSDHPTVPVTTLPSATSSAKPTQGSADPASAPAKDNTHAADPGSGSVPSATARGKSSEAPGHNKTPAPTSTKKTGKDRATEKTPSK
ncbi:MAG: hypothetical protein K4304_01190 [Propionicimonas sp.]